MSYDARLDLDGVAGPKLLAAWASGQGYRLAPVGLGGPTVYLDAPTAGRGPTARLVGPITGTLVTDDPCRLDAEGEALIEAARFLDALRTGWHVDRARAAGTVREVVAGELAVVDYDLHGVTITEAIPVDKARALGLDVEHPVARVDA